MTYTLYISRQCPYCFKIIDYCNENQIDYEVIDVDENTTDTKPVFVVPALFLNEELKAYGTDIIRYLEKAA